MADDDSDEEGPAIVLGEGPDVEGAPLARISARFMWGIEKSEIERREGDTTIRTPDGPRALGEILAEVEDTYFGTRQAFEEAVRDVIGHGPVPTPGTDDVDSGDDETEDEPADDQSEENEPDDPTDDAAEDAEADE